jgi:hypothetical protein
MYWMKYKTWAEGCSVQDKFFKVLKAVDPQAREATLEEQYKHIDFVSKLGTIDVKGKKRANRRMQTSSDIQWIEFKSNRGMPGWIYGSQDFIAFERDYGFILVKTLDLKNLSENLCNLGDRVYKSTEALYKGYSRKDRCDLLSMIKVEDILTLPYKVLNYDIEDLF